jgi:prepilin-type N-terminal cleavage/methylation domain-containing protein
MPFGDWYATRVYPGLSAVLSWLASPFGFSLTEVVVVIAIIAFFWILIRAIRRRKRWWRCLLGEAALLLGVVAWLYVGWGFNYFRSSIFQRAETIPMPYEEAEFQEFLEAFADGLNDSWYDVESVDPAAVEAHVKAWYATVPDAFGLCQPRTWQHPKRTLFNRLYSAVGVLGFIGPAFDEMHVNRDASPLEYPFLFAHEYAHVLGVSNEAEANFWAFEACRSAEDPVIRYSAWYMLLSHTAGNIHSMLGEEAFQAWCDTLIPEVFVDLELSQLHWADLRWVWLSRIQHRLYNAFLKTNRIPEGTASYGQVLRLVLTFSDLHTHDHGQED